MKKIFSLLLILFFARLGAESCVYTITEHPYRFSTYFEMEGKEKYEGRVIKSAISVRTVYDLYDKESHFVGQGICRLLSLGSVCSWARMIDLYDQNGETIGLIEGRLLTSAKASYNLYDSTGVIVAVAYLNLDASGFTVHDAKERVIVNMRRNFKTNALDSWDITQFDRSTLDERILKLFSAFAIDHQEDFKSNS